MQRRNIMATKHLRKFPKAGTIGNMVLTALDKDPGLKCETITKVVLKKFPDSKFNTAHLAWYKHQVKVGNYILPSCVGEEKVPKAKKARKPRAKKTKTPKPEKVEVTDAQEMLGDGDAIPASE